MCMNFGTPSSTLHEKCAISAKVCNHVIYRTCRKLYRVGLLLINPLFLTFDSYITGSCFSSSDEVTSLPKSVVKLLLNTDVVMPFFLAFIT